MKQNQRKIDELVQEVYLWWTKTLTRNTRKTKTVMSLIILVLALTVSLGAYSAYASVPVCGNNITEPGEACDGADINNLTCSGLPGYKSGALSCSADCKTYNVSQCVPGKTIAAASCQQADVQAAIDQALDGDTVLVPAGKCGWSSTINITRGITIKGDSEDTTVITAYGVCLFSITLASDADFRMTSLGFSGTGGGCDGLEAQLIRLSGDGNTIWNSFRADHLKFTNTSPFAFTIDPWWNMPSHPKAVFDHITFTSDMRSGFMKIAGNNNTWRYDDLYGTDWAIFIEDSNFSWNDESYNHNVTDTEHGARLVARNNTIVNGGIQMHDTGGTPAAKGQRITEIYNNVFNCTLADCFIPAMGIRGGGYIIYNNIISSKYSMPAWPQIWRSVVGVGFLGGMCNGNAVSACSTNTFYHCSGGDHRECSFPGDFTCNGIGTCIVAATSQSDCPVGSTYLPTVDNVDGGNDPSGWPCRNQTGWGKESLDGSTEEPSPVYWYNNKNQDGTTVYLPNSQQAYFKQDRDFCYHDSSTDCGFKSAWTYTSYPYPHPLTNLTTIIDTTPPSTPTNLTANAISSSQINLSWTASTDNVGVTGYKIYRCSGSSCAPTQLVNSQPANPLTYSDTGLTASTAYTYAVSAYDAAGNESGKSEGINVTTSSQNNTTEYYMDPDYTGNNGQSDGSAARPWITLGNKSSQAWQQINTALASAPVTIYFSAKEATLDAPEEIIGQVAVFRIDTSENRLTLDGMSKYNTNDINPYWVDYTGPHKMRIKILSGSFSIGWEQPSKNIPNKQHYVTLRGFEVTGSTARIVWGGSHTVVEKMWVHDITSIGANVQFAPAVSSYPDCVDLGRDTDITVRDNIIERGFGEGIYIGSNYSTTGYGGCPTYGNGHSNILIENNLIRDPGYYGGEGDGIDLKAGLMNVTVRNNIIERGSALTTGIVSSGVFSPGETNYIIEGNRIFARGGSGIRMAGQNGTVLRNNLIYNNAKAGIELSGGAGDDIFNTNVYIFNNTVYGNNFSALLIGDSNKVTIRNNLLFSNDLSLTFEGYQIAYPWDSSNINSDYNLMSSQGAHLTIAEGPHSITVAETANLTVSPLTGDFHLTAESPAIDKGTDLSASGFAYDIDKTFRPQGSAWDIGAYEYKDFATDNEAPSVPANLRATAISSFQINLSWDPSTDNIGVAGYKIFRCTGLACAPTTQIGTSTTNSFSSTGLTASTAYTYAVSAYDAIPNESGKSVSDQATTQVFTGNIYYIDYETGSDLNNGITKSAPWKRAPGMYGCTVNCLSKQQAGGNPGDQFILKGGVTWPHDVLVWEWNYGSGTEANPIYFGVDKTWYSGGSWTRPILDAQGQKPNPGLTIYNNVILRINTDWVIVDNIEFTGMPQLDDTFPGVGMLAVAPNPNMNVEVKNNYFHGWSRGGTATKDWMFILTTGLITEGPVMGVKIHDNVWDGSDTTKDMGTAYKGSAGHFYNNYIAYVANGIVASNIQYVWGNTFKDVASTLSFDESMHMNGLYAQIVGSVIYNNYLINSGGGTTIWTDNIENTTAYVFNNVSVNDSNQSLQIGNYLLTTGENAGIYVFNNTFQNSPGAGPAISVGQFADKPPVAFAVIRNNLSISTWNEIAWKYVTTQTESNNAGMTNAAATSARYISSGTYPYYPPEGGSTVNAGYDLTSFCSGVPSSSPSLASTACLSDTTLGVSYNANHTVSYPARSAIVRTTWDIGAYEYTADQAADLDKDGKVDSTDFSTLKLDWGKTTKPKSDINQDGIVDTRDLGIMMGEWG